MSPAHDSIEVLAACLDEYQEAARAGEPIDPAVYAERLGPLYDEFRGLVDTESALERVLEPEESTALPRNFGEYTLLRELGRGGMGVVYYARHRTLERDVALKVLKAAIDTDETARQRFKREAKALARVSHDHIVKVHDYGEVNGQPFYSMTLVTGPSLTELVKTGERPDPRTLCARLAPIADALEVLHQAGVVHRDVKPSNIMVDPETGRYLLADFGLARSATSVTMTRTGDSIGTPLYMSPEQILGKRDEVDARADVYGLGATLYELLVGHPPFKAEDTATLMPMVLAQRPTPPVALDPAIPRECSNIALKCLEKKREDRYQSAARVAEDLRAFAAGGRVVGRPVPALTHGARWLRRRPALAAAVLLAVLLPAWLVYRMQTLPAHLRVESPVPLEGRLLLDGEVVAMAVAAAGIEIERDRPYEVAFEPADPRLVVAPDRVTATSPGEVRVVKLYPFPRDPSDLESLELLAQATGVALGRQPSPGRERSALGEDEMLLVFPRGAVRPRDIREGRVELQLQVTEVFERKGHIVFRVDGAEVARLPLSEKDVAESIHELTRVPLPASLREVLRPGAQVEWSFEARDFVRRARFEVVADAAADAALERVAEAFAVAPYAPAERDALRAAFEARALGALGLHQAAYERVREHAARGGRAGVLHWEIQRAALVALFSVREQQSLGLLDRVLRQINAAPAAEREALYLPAGGDQR